MLNFYFFLTKFTSNQLFTKHWTLQAICLHTYKYSLYSKNVHTYAKFKTLFWMHWCKQEEYASYLECCRNVDFMSVGKVLLNMPKYLTYQIKYRKKKILPSIYGTQNRKDVFLFYVYRKKMILCIFFFWTNEKKIEQQLCKEKRRQIMCFAILSLPLLWKVSYSLVWF